MTARGEGGRFGRLDGNVERRAGAGQRVHFEALVAVGESGGAGFEAESMDVSQEGMRLRTAYLPELGDKLVCRFDGLGADLTVDGEVIWREEQERGGEFGVRFLAVDGEAALALRAMCAPPEAIRAPAPAQDASRGTRVRLHIEGLGSPMKARVRETATGEILVGSNLEFLRVGRALELEDVDHGSKREATIDHVKVEIDPVTNVPQLVVALAYAGSKPKDAAPGSTRVATLPFGAMAAAPAPSADRPPTPRPAMADASDDDVDASEPPAEARAPEPARRDDEISADEDEAEEAAALAGMRGAGAKAAKAGRAVAGKIGPALSLFGGRARGAMASAVAALQRRRAERDQAKKAAMPRRMTAPPPGGALKSEGRRLVRDEDAEGEAPVPPPRSARKAAVVGSLVGLVAVLAIFGVTRAMSSSRSAAGAPPVDTAAAVAAPPAAPALPPGTGGPVTANVPLFGATPLSTTEAVPAIPTPAATGGDPAAAPAAGGPDADPGAEEEPGLEDDHDDGPAKKEWGNGPVKSPIVLKLKMDGPIERLDGAAGAMGFTVSLPQRRSLSSASELARKDKRIASINVINNAHGAEVTVQFKDGVPPYIARAKGDRLEIALGTDGKGSSGASKKVARKSGAEKPAKKKAADAKKAAPSKAKAAPSKAKPAPKKKTKK